MGSKTYEVKLKAIKTSWGSLALNLSKSEKLLGGINIPINTVMATLVFTREKPYADSFYSNWTSMTELPDEFAVSSDLDNLSTCFSMGLKIKFIDARTMNVAHVKDMGQMFQDCENLEALDITGWDTSSVEAFFCMFDGCKKLREICGVIDMSSVKTYSNMFRNCPNLSGVKIKNPPDRFDGAGLRADQYVIVE